MKKIETAIQNDMRAPIHYGPEDAETTFICWGSTLGPLLEAMNMLNEKDKNRANVLQFTDLWPMPVEKVLPFLMNKKNLITVEGNFTAQLASILKMTTGIDITKQILKYDGRPFSPEFIVREFEEGER
jgi:2-oxoglutarate/2-oxoacid ferredoxin oxidoreductase subunit alpha